MVTLLRATALTAAICFSSPTLGQDNSIPVESTDPTDWAAIAEAAKAQQAAYDAVAAAAKSKQAMVEAEIAATKSKYVVQGVTDIGAVTASSPNAFKPEALLLVNKAAQDAADTIYLGLLKPLQDRPSKGVIVFDGASSAVTFSALLFDMKRDQVKSALHQAGIEFAEAQKNDKPTDGEGESVRAAGLATIGAITDGLSKLGSYFQSSYTFGSPDSTHSGSAVADYVAGKIKFDFPSRPVLNPAKIIVTNANSVLGDLETLSRESLKVAGQLAVAKKRASELKQSGNEPAAALYERSAETATRAIELHIALITKVAAEGAGDKEPFLIEVLRQKKLLEALEGNYLVLILHGDSAAQYYTKKNLWTFLGGPPVYTAGAISMSYALLDPMTSNVIAAGAIGKHGGYRSLRKVQRDFP